MPVTRMVAIMITHSYDFSSVIEHKTTSKNGEWSTYAIPAGRFNGKNFGNTYLQVNNFDGTATIFKSAKKNDTWTCN